ncbi:MAG: transcription elongation factor GreA [Erysipelotrichaceae bacterium]|nr:transcription elongation factor GreA [Erysipelotrichaceae bacterium]
MDKKEILVTEEGHAKLLEEYEHLLHVERDQVAEELKAARAQGDLSENADYDAARDHQARVEARIRELDEMLPNVKIITKSANALKTVGIGTNVTFEYQDTKEIESYDIIGTAEADPLNGKLSNETPLAIALIDHKVNDVVKVNVNPSYKVKILDIRPLQNVK